MSRLFRDLGLDIFRHKVVDEDSIASSITVSLLSFIKQERQGEQISRSTLSSILSLLSALSPTCSSTLFVTPFLAASTEFYKAEAERLINKESSSYLTPSAYLKHVVRRLEEEGERGEVALALSGFGRDLKSSLLRVVETEMVVQHTADILLGLKGFADDFNANFAAVESDLSRLYSLFSRVGQSSLLNAAWQNYVEVSCSSM